MAQMLRKRTVRKVVRPQQAKGGGKPPVSPARKAAMAGGILVVLALAVIVMLKYTGKTGTQVAAPGTAAPGVVPQEISTEGLRDSSAVVITNAAIVPPNPTSRNPLTIAYEAVNPGGGPLTATFRWYVDGNRVQDGPLSTLQPGQYRKGASVYAEVLIADQSTGSSMVITPAITIANGQPEVTSVVLGPENATTGSALSASPAGADPDGDPITYAYQWRVNGSPVGAAGGESTFSTSGLRKNDSVNVAVTFTDGTTNGGPVVSNSVILQNREPQITSAAPLGLSGNQYLYQVTAKDPDGDQLSYRLDRYPAGMTIDATGLITWQLPQAVIFTGKNDVGIAVTVSDGNGGTASQEWNITITDHMVN